MKTARSSRAYLAAAVAVAASTVLATVAAAQMKVPKEYRKLKQPDLVVAATKFEVVKNTRAADGSLCQIYNLTVNIGNQGDAAAGPFTVRIERQKGDLSAPFDLACQTCEWNVGGLGAGYYNDFPPRQFNNCGNNWNRFRVFVDYYNKVKESNETNNRKVVRYMLPMTRKSVSD